MRIKLPRPRFNLRTMAILIAVLAVTLWAGMLIWSPTRRFGRLLQADQPTYIRREAASSLGRNIPPWEVGQAVSLLIDALHDPSPRVREYAGVSLRELGPMAEPAVSTLIAVLSDKDRFVRFSAARTLGSIVTEGSAMRSKAVAAVTVLLYDGDPDVRVAAAETLLELDETQKAAGTVVAEFIETSPARRTRARWIIRRAKDPLPFVPMLAKELRNQNGDLRDEIIQTVQFIAGAEAVQSVLISALNDDKTEYRQWAAEQLKRIMPSP